ncbi:MAG: DinB family protein [Gemmatimonadota bacterium]
MASYTSGELAKAFKRVRGNTIRVAEEIPGEEYSFQPTPESRSIARHLAHNAVAPRMQEHIHRHEIRDFSKVDVPALLREIIELELVPRTKAEVLALLREEGERFGSFLDGLSDEFLDQRVMTPGDPSPTKSRLEMLMGVKEHEMHHRGRLMPIQRMLGIVPRLTRQREERLGPEIAHAPKERA